MTALQKIDGHPIDEEEWLIMIFTKQDRSCVVTLSEAKGLALRAPRCFAALSMTGPLLVVTFHHRRWAG